MHRSPFAALLAISVLAAPPASGAGVPSPAECETRFLADPEAEGSSECFLNAARGPQRQDAIHRAEDILRRYPRNAWLNFYLGDLFWNEPERSADSYRIAAGLLAERQDPVGAVRAEANLYSRLSELDRTAEAAAAVERAIRVAEESGDSLAIARVRTLEAARLSELNEDLPRAYRLLLQAEEALFPGGPYRMRRDCLGQLGNVALDLGYLSKARRHFEQLVTVTSRERDGYAEAGALYGLLRTLRDELALMPRPGGKEEALVLARRALATAEAAGHPKAEALSHVVLGLLTRGPEAQSHFESCLAVARNISDESYCRSAQAHSLTAEDPGAALHSVDEAFELAREAEDPWSIAYSWRERMRVSWRLGPPERAVKDSLEALDAIEVMRDLQTESTGRAEVFATWAGHYHWLAGRMLQERRAGLAFGVQERMRARALIDALEAARATSGRPGTGFATLEQVRQALAPDEALLSFQIAPWSDMAGDFMGGAWLIVVTNSRTSIHPLRDRLANRIDLRPAVESFAGLIEAEAEEGPGAAALYRALLADGLAGLPPGIRRLAIVPDDALHRVPFSALRPEPEGPSLALRYEITQATSATLWLRWRQAHRERSFLADAPPALVLADPDSLVTVDEEALERAADFAVPGGLGKLPWARREARAVVRHLGGGSRLRVGSEASESYLKKNGPGPFALLHFATHAWTDDVEPGRSFVLLSPGDGGKEDGFLRMREIAGLDLRGRIVVLSACSSASGEILRGEGVMGLARAFFQAGAHTVVASLWKLRDDHGAALFDRFYHHLGRGLNVAAALQAAQRDRMEDGAPATAWAGVVVLGDGGRVPLPGGRKRSGVWGWVAAGVLAAAICLLLRLFLMRSRA